MAGQFTNAPYLLGLPVNEGLLTADGNEYLVNYAGGDGNDITVTTIFVPEPTTASAAMLLAAYVGLRRRR